MFRTRKLELKWGAVDECLALLLETGASTEWWAFASSALAAVLAGIVLLVLKRHLSNRDETQRLQRVADTQERKRVEAGIAGLGVQIAAEAEERRAAVAEEANVRREKDDALGRDIVKGLNAIQNAFSYYCGKMAEKRPRFDE